MELSANKKTRRVLAMCIAAILLAFAVLFLPLVKFETTVFTKRSANTFVGDEKYLEAKAEVEAVCAKYDSDKLTVDESVTERTNSKGVTTSMVTFTVRETVSCSGWALLLANFGHSKGMTSVGVSNAVGIMMLCLAVSLILLLAAGMAGVSLYLAHLLTARLVQPIEQMTAHLNNVSGVARYPELEPFMDMIEQQHEEILRSANMRVEFTANVSHELKTPLTSISGYAELIESGMAQGEQAKTFAGEIHKSANRLLTLINDIIRLSQMDAPMPDLKFEPVDLAQIATNTFEQLEMSARKVDVTLQLDAKQAVVEADRQMMDELLYNLCDNAIRYNVRGGSVKLEVRPIRDKVIVCVQDTGIGISPENQEHVFERFYRVDKSRSKATGGTGLGLAIVKHIAVKHNAQIELESELGRGTKISVIFDRCFKA